MRHQVSQFADMNPIARYGTRWLFLLGLTQKARLSTLTAFRTLSAFQTTTILCKSYLFLFLAALPTVAAGQKSMFSIADFGAKGDGKTLNTSSIQKALDAAEKQGGGTVWIPAGTFLSGTLFLKGNLTLHLDAGAELRGSAAIADYNPAHPHLFYAEHAADIAITGKGRINGQGKKFWKEDYEPLARPVPWIVFERSTNLTIRDITLTESPSHVLVFRECNGVVVDGISILNEPKSPNTDGIDITSTSNVRISNCYIATGDDAICIKTNSADSSFAADEVVKAGASELLPVEHVTVSNCVIESDDAALKLGTGSGAPIRNCVFSNIVIKNSRFGVALFMKDGGVYESLLFQNIRMEMKSRHKTEYPIYIDVDRRTERARAGIIRQVQFNGLDISTRGNILISGHPDAPIEGLSLSNVSMRISDGVDLTKLDRKPTGNKKVSPAPGSTDYSKVLSHITIGYASDVNLSQVSVSTRRSTVGRTALHFAHVTGLVIDGFSARDAETRSTLPTAEFRHAGDVVIRNCDAAPNTNVFIKSDSLTGRFVVSHNNLLQAQTPWLFPKEAKKFFFQSNNLTKP
jgi:hypothetical protein